MNIKIFLEYSWLFNVSNFSNYGSFVGKLVSYIRRDLEEGMNTETAIIQAGEARMRQVFMTGLSACIGLVPAAISTGIGSQVQQPLACVIVGGMLLSRSAACW